MKLLYPYPINVELLKGPEVLQKNMYFVLKSIKNIEVINPFEEYSIDGQKFRKFLYSILGSSASYYPYIARRILEIKKREYDVVWTFSSAFRTYIEKLGTKIVTYLHNHPFVHLKYLKLDDVLHYNRIHNIFSRFLEAYRFKDLKKVSIIFANSEFTKRIIKTALNLDSIVLYPPVPRHLFNYIKNPRNEKLKIVIITNFIPVKGTRHFIKSLGKYLKTKEKQIEVHIYGDGIQRSQIISLIKNLKTSSICFMGRLNEKQKYETLTSYDVTLIPSFCETSSIVKYESFSAGVPVIGRDECAIGEFINRKTGFKFSDWDSLKDILDYIISNKQILLPMRRECRKISENFSFEKTSKRIKEIILS